jgi:hypothetical protein
MGKFNIIAGLRLNTSAFTTSLKGASLSLDKFTAAGSTGMKGLASATNLAVVGAAVLAKVVTSAVGIIMDFSKSLSELKAVSGASNKEIRALSEQAQFLGSVTVHTASEVVKLQTILARLGYSVTEIKAMTEAVLNLGTAMGTSLDNAASLVGSTLKAFNLTAEDSDRIADVLAKSTTITALSFDKLKIALPYATTAANQAGFTFEETAAMLGVLANKGFRASTMGTSLRKIFIKLSQKGLDYNTAMKMINDSTDKLKTSTDLFGVTAAGAGVVLAESTDILKSYVFQLNRAKGTTSEMARIMADNLSGDITLANSAWAGFVLSIDEGTGTLTKALRKLTRMFSDILNIMTYLNKGMIKPWQALYLAMTDVLKLITRFSVVGQLLPDGWFEPALKGFEDTEKSVKKGIGALDLWKAAMQDQLTLVQKLQAKLEADEIKAEEARKKKEEEAKKTKELADAIENLTDKYYLASLEGQKVAQASAEIEIWYKNEKKAIDALITSQEKKRELDNALTKAYEAKMAAKAKELRKGDTVKPIPTLGIESKGSIEDILPPIPTKAPEKLKTFNDLLGESVNITSQLASAFDILGDAISGAIEGQDQIFANMAVGVLKSVNKIINALLAEMIVGVFAKEASSKGIWGLAAAAIALPAAIGGMNVLIAKNKDKQNFATGGIVEGTSFSGDNVIAGLNSGEMVLNRAQQANLFAIANEGKATGGQVEFEIRGDRLVGVLNKHSRKMNKIR